jgi:Protein of unknown function (DUF664)
VNGADILLDGFGRVRDIVRSTVDGLSPEQLGHRLDADANSIGWLVWHLSRVQDDHVAAVAGTAQAWMTGGWFERSAVPFDAAAIGYGASSDDVAALRLPADFLVGYLDAVHARTLDYVHGLDDAQLDRVVDESWDPPVTLGVRLLSVVSDDLQHAGQAAFIRGIIDRTDG